ncbi:Crp/Fnr family transcriptional regulator [Myxococcota bacterium]|nr:Crp/Fnr family transcriptional regulator [Myxococcota bacterium]
MELRDLCTGCDGRAAAGQFTYERGSPLLLEGDRADAVHAIVSGCLREVRTTADGRLQTVRLIGAGELAGAEALASPAYHATVEALTPAIACKVAATEVQEHLAARPDLLRGFLAELSSEMQAIRDSALWLGALSAEERVLALLHRLKGSSEPGAFFELPLTRLEMSELLGVTHSTVSRVVQRLARAGVIEVRGRQVRLNGDVPPG